jgi:hypothetical protein
MLKFFFIYDYWMWALWKQPTNSFWMIVARSLTKMGHLRPVAAQVLAEY